MITVPAQLPRNLPAPIAFLGEAPGDDEMEKGRPLVGPSGRVFDALLRTAEIDRRDCWVGNVFDTKLPSNDVSNWCAPTAEAKEGGFDNVPIIKGSGFLRPEYHSHLDRLKQELEDVKPTVIVPLGGTALWALMGSNAITQFRGTIIGAERLMPGAKLAPTYHPAYVMRQWQMFVIVVGDLLKAMKEADRGPQIEYPKRELLLSPSLAECRAYRDICLGSDLLSVDIETSKGEIDCIGFAPDQEHAICIPFKDTRKAGGRYWSTPEKEFEAWKIVKEICESPVPKLGQNYSGYDAPWLLEKMGIQTRNLLHDTRLIHHALYPELPKSLQFMGATYTNQGPWKNWGAHKEKRDD